MEWVSRSAAESESCMHAKVGDNTHSRPKDRINMRIQRSGFKTQDKGILSTMVCRILMCKRSFGLPTQSQGTFTVPAARVPPGAQSGPSHYAAGYGR